MIHRIELFGIRPGADPAEVARLERALVEAPRHTPARRVRLGRSASLRHGWTHVWEQDYDDVDRLDAYMSDAHHWAVLDPFFDATNPAAVVDRVTVAAYDTAAAGGAGDDRSGGLRRILLIRVEPSAGDPGLAALRDAIAAAAPRLPLQAWRTAPLLAHRHGWSLVWEQTFAGETELAAYMCHPAHWAGVDPLFDAENPAVVVARTSMAWYPLPGLTG